MAAEEPAKDDRRRGPDDLRRAVAMRYDRELESAPRLLAKGSGLTADRIIAIAREHGIPLHEDHDLVRLLAVLDIDVEVPPALYRALAEVLAHLYRANARPGATPPAFPAAQRPTT